MKKIKYFVINTYNQTIDVFLCSNNTEAIKMFKDRNYSPKYFLVSPIKKTIKK